MTGSKESLPNSCDARDSHHYCTESQPESQNWSSEAALTAVQLECDLRAFHLTDVSLEQSILTCFRLVLGEIPHENEPESSN